MNALGIGHKDNLDSDYEGPETREHDDAINID